MKEDMAAETRTALILGTGEDIDNWPRSQRHDHATG